MTNARYYNGPLAGKSVVVAPGFEAEFADLYGDKGMKPGSVFNVISDCTLNVASVQGIPTRLVTFSDSEGHVSTSGAHRFLVQEL